MRPIRWVVLIVLAVVVGAAGIACSRHYVVVTPPEDGYSRRDTLYGRLYGDEIRVTFRFDTTFRVDTVTRLDTLWEEGARVDTVLRIDSLLRVDTLRYVAFDTLARTDTVVRVDTLMVYNDAVPRPDTVVVVDTVRLASTDTVVRTDTVATVDTVRVAITQTVVRVDTLRVPGRRHLFLPPGHYPPDGQCRVWVVGRPPGQQAPAAACDALGEIPGGAFILFGGEAWDADWDWVAEARENPGSVPPEILAVQRPGGGRPR